MERFYSFIFGSKAKEEEPKLQSITREQNDGSIVVTRGEGGDVIGDSWAWSTSMDLDPLIVSEQALITKYREMSLVDVIDKAIDIIVNEMVSTGSDEPVSINLDKLGYSEELKDKISAEFDHILKLMNFNGECYEILRRWYVDGRLQYQVIIDKEKYKEDGIGKLTYLDPRKLKKVRVVTREKDPSTSVNLYQENISYYLYSEHGFLNTSTSTTDIASHNATVKITNEGIVQVTSGLLDPTNSVVLSYLHKAIRPLNQLKGLEDATMIYKLSRAPERRIFYIDVGNLPPAKAEQVLQKQMNQYRSKMVYDVNTGGVRTDPKQMTMIEDYWLPRRSDGRATEITTLPAGQMSGEMGELNWFLNKLYNSLNVPITRMDPQTGFSFGRSTEITRDEVMLTKFIDRLRRRFSGIFLDLLQRQLALKNILNDVEFENIRQDISFKFDSDNHFDEILSLEILETRLNTLDRIVNYMPGGQVPQATMFSKEWVYKNVLFMTDEDIEIMTAEIEKEKPDAKKALEDAGMLQPGDEGDNNVSRVIYSNTTPPNKSSGSQQTNKNINSNNSSSTSFSANSSSVSVGSSTSSGSK